MKANELRDERVRIIIDLSSVIVNARLGFSYVFERLKNCSERDLVAHILSIGADSLRNENLTTELGEMLDLPDNVDISSVDFVLQLLVEEVTRSVIQILPSIDFDKYVFEEWIDVNQYTAVFSHTPEYSDAEGEVHSDFSSSDF